MKYPQKYGKQENSTTYRPETATPYKTQNKIDRWTKGCIIFSPKKCDLEIAKNYWGITLTAIAAKIYNALLLKRIEPEIEKILRKKQKCLSEKSIHDITNFDYPSNFRCSCKIPLGDYYLEISPRHLTPYTERRWNTYFSPMVSPKKQSLA